MVGVIGRGGLVAVVRSLREALAAGTWDVECPAAADLTPEGMAASERAAATLAARERVE